MKRNIIIFVILAIGMFTSCVDEVNIHNQLGENQKLVLYARLCPQLDSTYILLSNTQLLYSGNGGSIRYLDDGVVELSADGSHWVQAHFYPMRNRFLITREEFPIEEGHTYYIRASHPGFEEVSASCTVPVTHNVGFRFDTVEVSGDTHWGDVYNWPHKDVYVEWRDVAGEENAYAMKSYAWQTYHNYDPNEGEIEGLYWGFYDIWLTEDDHDFEYVSDEGRDGELMRFLFDADIYDWEYDDWKGWDDDEHPAQYYLLFLDKGSYLYETTLSEDNVMNFLLLEPPHTYTNIEGGFGLFGAFSMLPINSIP